VTAEIFTQPNLRLAWRRITTGTNVQYKGLFRNVYRAYELAIDRNIRDLYERLRGGAYVAQRVERMYLPKASGLHRPIGLLHLEDQIILQAFANIAARRMQPKRETLQLDVVFSNIVSRKPGSAFFFRDWRKAYRAYERRISEQFFGGMRWVADFDLAAYYDTISHDLLIRTVFPRTLTDEIAFVRTCLGAWSSGSSSSTIDHGLPQGPLASDYLAECFLLPIDLALRSHRGYVRYVDDIRLFGQTELDVRSSVVQLEQHCRERGLIPQVGKFAIKRARAIDEALGALPSISDPAHPSGDEALPRQRARTLLRSAIALRPTRIIDKSRVRYVLFRAPADSVLLQIVFRLVPYHPEHADVFFHYMGRFGYRRPVERLCLGIIRESPYPYLRGEAWHVLAHYRLVPRSETAADAKRLTEHAVSIAKTANGPQEQFAERWGACHFLCASEEASGQHLSRYLQYQSPLLQSFLGPLLPRGAFGAGETAAAFLRRTSPEPGLSIAAALHEWRVSLATLGVAAENLPSQVSHALRALGSLPSTASRVDAIGEILARRYGVRSNKSWRRLLGAEYGYTVGLLNQAEVAFDGAPSHWLQCQNSFNHAVFLALQRHFAAIGHPATCKTVGRDRRMIDYGVMLEASGPFSTQFPVLGAKLRLVNGRRNALPASHPYDKRTTLPSTLLSRPERNRLVAVFRAAYADLAKVLP
jgi:Reverse transcriptase (RNA-dependent DNA polymerase)